MNYVALDLEMTGLHLKTDHIIEIGAVRMESGNAAAHFSTLVNPHQTLSAHIIDLTGITDDMLRDAPEIGEVLPKFCIGSGAEHGKTNPIYTYSGGIRTYLYLLACRLHGRNKTDKLD